MSQENLFVNTDKGSTILDNSSQFYKRDLIKRKSSPRRPATCVMASDVNIREPEFEKLRSCADDSQSHSSENSKYSKPKVSPTHGFGFALSSPQLNSILAKRLEAGSKLELKPNEIKIPSPSKGITPSTSKSFKRPSCEEGKNDPATNFIGAKRQSSNVSTVSWRDNLKKVSKNDASSVSSGSAIQSTTNSIETLKLNPVVGKSKDEAERKTGDPLEKDKPSLVKPSTILHENAKAPFVPYVKPKLSPISESKTRPFSSVADKTKPFTIYDEKPKPFIISDEKQKPHFVSDIKPKHLVISDEKQKPSFVPDVKPKPLVISDEKQKPPFVSDVKPKPSVLTDKKLNPLTGSDDMHKPCINLNSKPKPLTTSNEIPKPSVISDEKPKTIPSHANTRDLLSNPKFKNNPFLNKLNDDSFKASSPVQRTPNRYENRSNSLSKESPQNINSNRLAISPNSLTPGKVGDLKSKFSSFETDQTDKNTNAYPSSTSVSCNIDNENKKPIYTNTSATDSAQKTTIQRTDEDICEKGESSFKSKVKECPPNTAHEVTPECETKLRNENIRSKVKDGGYIPKTSSAGQKSTTNLRSRHSDPLNNQKPLNTYLNTLKNLKQVETKRRSGTKINSETPSFMTEFLSKKKLKNTSADGEDTNSKA